MAGEMGKLSVRTARTSAERASNEAKPREGQLLDGRKAYAADDGKEAEVHGDGEELLEADGEDERRPDRLGRLEHVRERDGARAERDDAADVRRGKEKCLRRERLDVVKGELGRLAEAGAPERQHVRESEKELHRGRGPRNRQRGQHEFVANVVGGVEEIPQHEEGTQLDGALEALLAGERVDRDRFAELGVGDEAALLSLIDHLGRTRC